MWINVFKIGRNVNIGVFHYPLVCVIVHTSANLPEKQKPEESENDSITMTLEFEFIKTLLTLNKEFL